MLSLDSSFRNSCRNRTNSIPAIGTSNRSPRSNRNATKPTSDSKSKFIEGRNKPETVPKRATGVQTPKKYYTGTSKDSLSPLGTAKSQINKKGFESETRKSHDTTKSSRNVPAKSSNKPLISNLTPSTSRISTPFGFSEFRRSTLNESMDMNSKSISDMVDHAILPQAKPEITSAKINSPLKSVIKNLEPEINLIPMKNGKMIEAPVSGPTSKKSKSIGNSSLLLQNVYSIKTKPLMNTLRPVSRSKNREEDRKGSIVGSMSSLKENDSKMSKSTLTNFEGENDMSAKKRQSEPLERENHLEVKKILSTGFPSSIGDRFSPESPLSPYKNKKLECSRDEGEGFKIREIEQESIIEQLEEANEQEDVHEVSQEKEKMMQVVQDQSNNKLETGGHHPALEKLNNQLELFVRKVEDVMSEILLKEKRMFIIKLLEMLHAHKVRLSKFFSTQEFNRKSLCFYHWQEYVRLSKEERQEDRIKVYEPVEEEDVGLKKAIAFHEHSLLHKYFYEGFLGHYALCKLGNNNITEESALPSSKPPRQDTMLSTRKSVSTLQSTRKGTSDTEPYNSKIVRSKTPVPAKSGETVKPNIKASTGKKPAPTSKSPYKRQQSHNQSFTAGIEKGNKKEDRSYPKSPSKTPSKVTSNNTSHLDQSFGQSNTRPSSGKRISSGSVIAAIWQQNKSLCEPENLEKVLAGLPQSAKKGGCNTEIQSGRTNTLENHKSVTYPSQPSTRRENQIHKTVAGGHIGDKKTQEAEKRAVERNNAAKSAKKNMEVKKEVHNVKEIKNISRTVSNKGQKEAEKSPLLKKRETRRSSLSEIDNQEIKEASLKKALEFRRHHLLNTYGHLFISKLVELVNRKLEAAWYLRIRNLLKRGFLGLYSGIQKPRKTLDLIESVNEEDELTTARERDGEEERDEIIKIKMQIAQEHYEANMKMNIFNALLENFIKSHEENMLYDKHRENCLTRSCFAAWIKLLPKLKTKNQNNGLKYGSIIEKFRYIVLTEKAMRQFKALVHEATKRKATGNKKKTG